MIDRFGREVDDEVKIKFEDGGEVRLRDGSTAFRGKGPTAAESFHSEYFKAPDGKTAGGKTQFAETSRRHSIVVGTASAAALIVYGMLFNDVPVIFFAMSFIAFALAPLAGKLAVPAAEDAMWAFSVTTFVGAIILAIF